MIASQTLRAHGPSRIVVRKVLFAAAIVVGVAILMFPVYWIVLSAFTPEQILFSSHFNFLPLHWSLANFRTGFQVVPVGSYFLHSVVLGVVPACLAMLVALPAGYAFGRLKFFGRGGILALIVFSGFLPVVASIIPLFELFKDLHIIGTWWALFLVYTGFLLGFTTWILSLFVARIPIEVEEAARLDGANEPALLRFVIVPLLRPAIASLFIVDFLASWNQFLLPTIFSTSTSTSPLVLGISQASQNPQLHSVAWGPQAAFGLIVVVPAIIVVLIFQRRIAGGLTAGAVKG